MLFLLFAQLLGLCYAFGFPGHRLAAALTFDLLPDSVVHDCLGFPYHSQKKSIKLAFIRLACRPDRIKHRPGMEWAQSLHFLNVLDDPPNCCHADREIAGMCGEGPNLLSAVANYTMRLAAAEKPLDVNAQSQVLSFMVHFVTDLHQPLHVSSKAKGGNHLRVLFNGKTRSLHSLWDTDMLVKFMDEHTPRQVIRILRHRIMNLFLVEGDRLDVVEWAAGTNAVNCGYVWRLSRGDYAAEYYDRTVPVLLDLIAQSALRTAKLLQLTCQ